MMKLFKHKKQSIQTQRQYNLAIRLYNYYNTNELCVRYRNTIEVIYNNLSNSNYIVSVLNLLKSIKEANDIQDDACKVYNAVLRFYKCVFAARIHAFECTYAMVANDTQTSVTNVSEIVKQLSDRKCVNNMLEKLAHAGNWKQVKEEAQVLYYELVYLSKYTIKN